MLPILITFRRPFSTKVLRHSYTVLKVNAKATPNEIRESYLKLSKIYHPDTAATGSQVKFIRLRQAYERIKDAPLTLEGCDEIKELKYSDLSHNDYVQIVRKNKEYSYNAPNPDLDVYSTPVGNIRRRFKGFIRRIKKDFLNFSEK